MKEYRLKIIGVEDFVIISPKVLGLLLKKINEADNRTMEIPVESIMPPGYTQYLLNVINSNRELKVFHFSQIKDALLSEEHIYQIIEHQMQRLQIEMDDCFENIVLCVDNSEKSMKYDVETKNLFFCICKNENSRFVYVFPDGNRETILVEWNH